MTMLPGQPIVLATDEAVMLDLRRRLEATRFPREQDGTDWQTGTPLAYATRLRDYWLETFDWSGWTTRINRLTQRMIEVDGMKTHFIIEQGSGPAPTPLLLANGWPSSFVEFLDMIDPLAHPERHGGRVEDAFTVIIPSMPGYGLSPPPAAPVTPGDIASAWRSLMVDHLGFDSFVAFGSDWGSLVVSKMAQARPKALQAFLITSAGGIPANLDPQSFTQEELAWQGEAELRSRRDSAYQLVQATKPQSLAYGQTDSPIGLASWVIEKFHDWTTPGSAEDPPFNMDSLLANVMLYWLGGCLSPMWLYGSLADMTQMIVQPTPTPGAFLQFPSDLVPPAPRSWLERSFNVARYTVGEGGGHFPGMENPDLLISELREFFRAYR